VWKDIIACTPFASNAKRPSGLEVSRPPSLAAHPSRYAYLAGRAGVHLAHVGGSAPPSCLAAQRGARVNPFSAFWE
jgi:hypothetical protein